MKKKIKIKEKNKGSFTRWAKKKGKTSKGKVTSAAIEAGLKSKSKKIRKKAQFAKNARSWNHSKRK